ncbi:MAG: single-stranded DNA-binding protein [Bacilli bacterium]|nr:single-stranded DNA-binding protein [Bacilli bacterium]
MNRVILIGRLARDPELRYTSSNIPTCTFSLAVNRNFTNQAGEREADFINIVVWRKQAENCKNYLNQGSQVAVEGRIQVRNYEDQNGQKRYVTEVIADNVQFLDTKAAREQRVSSSSDINPYNLSEAEAPQTTTDIPEDPFKDFGEEIKIEENDLPF